MEMQQQKEEEEDSAGAPVMVTSTTAAPTSVVTATGLVSTPALQKSVEVRLERREGGRRKGGREREEEGGRGGRIGYFQPHDCSVHSYSAPVACLQVGGGHMCGLM
jgi:hypothetical protein